MNSANTENNQKNPYLSKWNILFEKEGKPWMSVRPQEGTEVYTCYACREIFGSKSSFLDHVNRFTIVLNFKCNMCFIPEEHQFYNPCALLLHSRLHYTAFGGHIALDDIKVSCLPFGLIGFPPQHDIPMIYNVKDDSSDGTNNTRFYSPARVNKGKSIINMLPTILLFYHYKLNGTPPASLVLKQISSNIPRCIFTRLENNAVSTNIVNAVCEKALTHQEPVPIVSTETPIRTEETPLKANTQNQKQQPVQNKIDAPTINEDPLGEADKENGNVAVKEEAVSDDNDSSDQTNDIQDLVPMGMQNLKNLEGNTCLECKTVLPYNKLMSLHFAATNPLHDSCQCDTCKYIAASPCSLSAHKRLHMRQAPFVCPECGREFDSNISLLDHLEDVCFHLAKQVRFRCPKKNCCKVFAQLGTFMTHFEVHIQTLNKCDSCHETFYAIRDLMEHSGIDHNRKIVKADIIYKCTICRNSTLLKENFNHHVRWHCTDKTLRVYVYICKFCRNFFRSNLTYANHMLRCSKKNLTNEELRRIKKSNAAMVCLYCNFVVRLITNSFDCPRCGRPTTNTTVSNPLRGKTSPVENNNNNNNNNNNYENNANTRMIKCILCYNDLVFSEASAHECKYKNPAVLLTRDDENIQKIANIKREMTNLTNHTPKMDIIKRKRKKLTSPMSSKNKRLSGHYDQDIQLEEPQPFEGIYSCRICEFKENDRYSFHEHIKEHKEVSTAYQCMECGECFVVKPSFHKHLQYYHKIANVDQYLRDNECVDRSAISKLKKHMRIESGEINDDVEENQCRVCLKQFDHSLELSKHFRMHGMAFLRNNK